MKFKELRSILSVVDSYEIRLQTHTIICNDDSIDEVIEENKLNDKDVFFIRAVDEKYLYICLKDNKE